MLLRVLVSVAVAVGGLTLASPAQAAACTDVEVITVRGTGEPGTYGSVVGDNVVKQLQQKLAGRRSVGGYAVDYPATMAPDSSNLGREALVAHVKAQAKACPRQAFVLSGYSQGAAVVGNALGITMNGRQMPDPGTVIAPSVAPRVKAVLLFGNPLRLTGVGLGDYTSRTMDICRSGDPACESGGSNILTHSRYQSDTDAATTFAVKRLGSAVAPAAPSPSVSSAPRVPAPTTSATATEPPAPAPPKVPAAPSMSELLGWIVGMIAWPPVTR